MGWCNLTNEKIYHEKYHFIYEENDNWFGLDESYDDFDDDDLDSPF